MRYNLADETEQKQAVDYLKQLIEKKVQVRISRIVRRRSLSQNSYLHLLLSYFGQHFGYTLEEAKILYKQLNPSIYVYRKNNHTFLRSSAELDTVEMTKSIDKFREESKALGFPLPSPDEQEWLARIENDVERAGYWL